MTQTLTPAERGWIDGCRRAAEIHRLHGGQNDPAAIRCDAEIRMIEARAALRAATAERVEADASADERPTLVSRQRRADSAAAEERAALAEVNAAEAAFWGLVDEIGIPEIVALIEEQHAKRERTA